MAACAVGWGLEGAGGEEGAAEALKGVWLMVLSTTEWAPAERGVGGRGRTSWVPSDGKKVSRSNDFNPMLWVNPMG